MPQASPDTIERITDVLANGDFGARRNLLRTEPISPPDGSTRMFDDERVHGSLDRWQKLKITDNKDLICFIRLKPVDRDKIGAVTFDTRFPDELPTTASRIGWIPCWFLPWASMRIIKLKIPDVTSTPVIDFGGAIDPIPNPGLFFTAALSGCSVFGVGAAHTPSVYHGGFISGAQPPILPGETTEMMWRRLIGRAATAKYVGGVGKSDYVAELNDPATTDDTNRFKHKEYRSTRRAAELENLLDARGTLKRVQVSPWGAVFGLRDDGGDWSLTLVQNATITYMRLIRTVTKRRFLKDKVTTREEGEGGSATTMISHSYNLGYKEFFPGMGTVQVRHVDTDQIF